MQFIHYPLGLVEQGSVVEVTVDARVCVRLLDGMNFDAYKQGRAHRYIGGEVLRSPVRLEAPHMSEWHVVLDFNGGSGSVRSTVNVRRRA
jgi:hypothetical protein